MPRTAGKRCLSNLQLGPGELVWEMWDRTSSKPPDRNLTCCPSPTRSPSRRQVEICLSSLSWWCPGSASRSSPLVNSPGQSRRRGPPTGSRGGDAGREGESQPEPGLGSPARRQVGLQKQPRVSAFQPRLRWRSPWLARVHRGNPTLRSHRGTLSTKLS